MDNVLKLEVRDKKAEVSMWQRHCEEPTAGSTKKQSSVNNKVRMDCVFALTRVRLIAMT